MAEPPAADQPPQEEWDPLQAEYEDLRAQELERSRRTYKRRLNKLNHLFREDPDGTVRMVGRGQDDVDG